MYKTIVVHLNDERRAPAVLSAATRIAARFQSHLIGLFVMPTLVVGVGPAAEFAGGLMEAGLKTFRDQADRIKAIFERETKGKTLVAEWRFVEPHREPFLRVLMQHVRAADLVVAAQADRDWDDTLLLDVPDTLAMESGRPTLIVPRSGAQATIGSRITVAWNGRREAARATFDALPLLKMADAVRILWVNPQDDPRGLGDVPTVDIAAALARHGVKCEAARSASPDLKVGDELLSRLADGSADLLVMGAYGHSRVREFIFGGTTRHMLSHMTVPVLMSH